MSDDRPKKSWRELDRAREKSAHRPGERDRSSVQRTPLQPERHFQDRYGSSMPKKGEIQKSHAQGIRDHAYNQYKSKLNDLFKPGGTELPESLKQKLPEASAATKAQKTALEALKNKPNKENLRAYLKTEGAWPKDARLLTSLLDVNDDELVLQVAEQLIVLLTDDGQKPARTLLLQRIQAARMKAASPKTIEKLDELKRELEEY